MSLLRGQNRSINLRLGVGHAVPANNIRVRHILQLKFGNICVYLPVQMKLDVESK